VQNYSKRESGGVRTFLMQGGGGKTATKYERAHDAWGKNDLGIGEVKNSRKKTTRGKEREFTPERYLLKKGARDQLCNQYLEQGGIRLKTLRQPGTGVRGGTRLKDLRRSRVRLSHRPSQRRLVGKNTEKKKKKNPQTKHNYQKKKTAGHQEKGTPPPKLKQPTTSKI